MTRGWKPAAVVAAFLGLVLWVARRDYSRPNLRLFWDDMATSPAYASQSENRLFPNGRTEQTPPEGALARDEAPFLYPATDDGRERAGKELKNPYRPTRETLARGRWVYENYCLHCHGTEGLGDGPVAAKYSQLGFPAAAPPIYEMPDGTLFHVITFGNNNMPSHASQLEAADRWKVILYLRVLQRRQLPPDEKH